MLKSMGCTALLLEREEGERVGRERERQGRAEVEEAREVVVMTVCVCDEGDGGERREATVGES